MADNETIADIIAWLRRPREGENAYLTLWRDEIADRLEAAHRREHGDAAKLREALEFCVKGMCGYCRMDAEARGMTTECVNGCEALLMAKAALAAPPRNCDAHTADELKVIFRSELVSELPIANEHEKNLVAITAMGVIDMLLAPATEKEGGAE